MTYEPEPIHPLATKSFWLAVATVAIPVLDRNGIDMLALLGMPEGTDVATVVDLLWTIGVPILTGLGVLYQRRGAPGANRPYSIHGPFT